MQHSSTETPAAPFSLAAAKIKAHELKAKSKSDLLAQVGTEARLEGCRQRQRPGCRSLTGVFRLHPYQPPHTAPAAAAARPQAGAGCPARRQGHRRCPQQAVQDVSAVAPPPLQQQQGGNRAAEGSGGSWASRCWTQKLCWTLTPLLNAAVGHCSSKLEWQLASCDSGAQHRQQTLPSQQLLATGCGSSINAAPRQQAPSHSTQLSHGPSHKLWR